jgi:Hypothetical glycosyl hydrolase family 15
MRRRLSGLAVATLVAVAATACARGPAPAPPAACASAERPGVPLAIRLAAPPTRARALCIARQYAAVFATSDGWGRLPQAMRSTSPTLQLWEERSLLYACDGCPTALFSLPWVAANHPDWIAHTAAGADVHPIGHPELTLLDFTSLEYQSAWAARMAQVLEHDGFTGVDVVDASNDPRWDGVPVVENVDVPRRELDERARRFLLGKALAVVRDVLKQRGFLLAAENGPAEVVLPNQINSTDAVSVGTGFAKASGAGWGTLFRYFHRVFRERVGALVWDVRRPLSERQRVYGLASYLLVAATPVAAYGVAADPSDPLYRISLGQPTDGEPVPQGQAWVRAYAGGAVVVNPALVPATVQLDGRRLDLPPQSAAIEDGNRLIRSEPVQ